MIINCETEIIADSGKKSFKANDGKMIEYRSIKILGANDESLIPVKVPNTFDELPIRENINMTLILKVQKDKITLTLEKLGN